MLTTFVKYLTRLRQLSASVDLAEAMATRVRSRDDDTTRLAVLTEQLRLARNTIAVLYAGNLARRADGTVDVDRVIAATLGDA